ncbi:lasso peptide [Mastigocladopsis repens]|uniref:lasso peptide n=1 Tax=Mastigocladopsis repens TaxID=221287 RepID=UPI0002EFE415|nr:lasso peptide [Mastigocladopsis repens]
MKKTYQTPKLLNHGSVSEITALTGGSNRTDFLFGTDGQTTLASASGSLDACIFGQGKPTSEDKCIVK